MKILHVVDSMDSSKGGVCEAVKLMISGTKNLNVINEIATLNYDGFQTTAKLTIHDLGPGKSSWSFSKKLQPWLNLHVCRFDVIILHGLWLYQGYAVKKALQKIKPDKKEKRAKGFPKLLIMPHGMLDPYFQKFSVRRFKVIRNFLYWHLIEKSLVNKSDGMLFTCRMEEKLARKSFAYYSPKTTNVIGLGVNTPLPFHPEMLHQFFKHHTKVPLQPYLLFLGRIHPKKGIDLIIKAYADILESKINLPPIVIAGPGWNTDYGVELKKKIQSLPRLENVVYCVNMLTNKDKWGAIYGCEAFILPSHQENFGISIVEAMSCRKPVLTTNKVNIWEEIKSGNAGMIEDDTLAGIKKLLNAYLKLSTAEKKYMQANAYTLYETSFTAGAVWQKLHSSLHSI